MKGPLVKIVRSEIRAHNQTRTPTVHLTRVTFVPGTRARVSIMAGGESYFIDVPRDLPKTARNRVHKALKRLG